MKFRKFASDFAIGCTTHFLLAMAALVFLGGAVHYRGLGRILFVIAAVVLFFAAALFPWNKWKEP
jgi:hypothetical protein